MAAAGGGKWGAILHIHVAFDALERGTFVCVLWIDILVSVCIQIIVINSENHYNGVECSSKDQG